MSSTKGNSSRAQGGESGSGFVEPGPSGFGEGFAGGSFGVRESGGKAPVSGAQGSGGSPAAGPGLGYSGTASPNVGLVRKVGARRVLGGAKSVRDVGSATVKSYVTSSSLQFNDVEELRSDAISRAFSQEILEKLWAKWGLDTSKPDVMRKAEDVIHALFAMRTASPDADYDVAVVLGGVEVNLLEFAQLLRDHEVTRRRFSRAIADDIRAFIADPGNVRLRDILATELGVKPEYAILAFDGSTHCSGMSANQVSFTKQLEHMNLFDSREVRDKLSTGRSLITGGFQVNRDRGAYS